MGKYYVDKYCEKCGCQLHTYNMGGQLFCDNCKSVANPVTKDELTLEALLKRVEAIENKLASFEGLNPLT